jgi:hypothetical protein
MSNLRRHDIQHCACAVMLSVICHYSECRILFIVMLSDVMLNVIMLSVMAGFVAFSIASLFIVFNEEIF